MIPSHSPIRFREGSLFIRLKEFPRTGAMILASSRRGVNFGLDFEFFKVCENNSCVLGYYRNFLFFEFRRGG